jgi:hypothetical protein
MFTAWSPGCRAAAHVAPEAIEQQENREPQQGSHDGRQPKAKRRQGIAPQTYNPQQDNAVIQQQRKHGKRLLPGRVKTQSRTESNDQIHQDDQAECVLTE